MPDDEIAEVKRRTRDLTLRLVSGDVSEGEEKSIIEELSRIVPDPEYTDYVFWPEEDGPISDVVDKAIEKAFQYKPIAL